ncbi:hypothetical protein ABZ815_23125 [Nonomuraea sp. NPDC047529]|uniref:hypothetical protein n=1 Tax=Nonomuraea sp. NPDC047529 TaxID=3155623 RepID=UPI0033C6AC87
MSESSPHRDDRTPEERALGSDASAPACPSPDGRLPRARDTSTGPGAPDVRLEISEVRVEELDVEGEDLHARLGGTRARATLRIRLDDVAHLIDRLLDADPHFLDHLPASLPRHALRTAGTSAPGTPASAAHEAGAAMGRAREPGTGVDRAREGGTPRDWPRGGAPSWRPGRKHAGDLGAATGRTVHHPPPVEEPLHTVPGHEVLDVETHAGTDARPMTEQATRHGDVPRPTPPTRPYFAPDEGTTPDDPSDITPHEPAGTTQYGTRAQRPGRTARPSPTDGLSRRPRPSAQDPGPGRSKTPPTDVSPRPGLDPPPPEPPHPSLAHRIPAQPGPPPHAPPHHDRTPQGSAQPRPGRAPTPPGPALYRPGLDPPPQSGRPHDQARLPRHARSTREAPAGHDRATEPATKAGAGSGAGTVAENEGASGNRVASERLGGVAAGWS